MPALSTDTSCNASDSLGSTSQVCIQIQCPVCNIARDFDTSNELVTVPVPKGALHAGMDGFSLALEGALW